jgi:RNA polymerase sigma factor (sigma-70 family)
VPAGPTLSFVAGLARIVRDVGVAEELAQDALVAALEQWPADGIPDNPAAWLMGVAKHRALDLARRGQRLGEKHAELAHALAERESTPPDFTSSLDDDIGDDLLRLVFTACHPGLSREARVALTLRLLCGLSTDEIARGCLVPEPTIAQRIVRAKRTLADEQVGFETPHGPELAARLASVLEVVYLVFNEGYSATAGDNGRANPTADRDVGDVRGRDRTGSVGHSACLAGRRREHGDGVGTARGERNGRRQR